MDFTTASGSSGGVFAGIIAVLLGVGLIVIVVSVAIHILICLLLYKSYQRIPAEHRRLEPALVWLLMIPCFNVIWNFFVYPPLSRSFASYFEERGIRDVGDCGLGIAWGYVICSVISIVLSFVPAVSGIATLAALVLLIIFLVKTSDLKNKIPNGQ